MNTATQSFPDLIMRCKRRQSFFCRQYSATIVSNRFIFCNTLRYLTHFRVHYDPYSFYYSHYNCHSLSINARRFFASTIKRIGNEIPTAPDSAEFNKLMLRKRIVFSFVLTLMAEGNECCIEEVFGSDDDEKAVLENGEVMNEY
eukprot:5844_1